MAKHQSPGSPVKLSNKHQIQQLKCVLESLLPASIQVFNCVVLELLEDGVDREIFVNSEFSKEKIIVAVFDNSEEPRLKIILFSNPEKGEELKHMLENLLDFSKPLLFGGLTRFQQQVIQSFYGEKQSQWASECHIFMDWDKGQQSVLPVDSCDEKITAGEEGKDRLKFEVSPVSLEHVQLVDNSWKFQNSKSVQMLEGLIKQKKLLGLFIEGNTEPVAWITIYSYGSMGMLNTKEQFRRQGWGQVLVSAAKEYARSLGLVPYVHIEEDNLISAKMFKKLGFVPDQYAVWAGYDGIAY